MLDAYAEFGCGEVWNHARTQAYAEAGVKPATGEIGACGCPELGEMLGESYTTPASDPAPWYDEKRPESADFGGLLVTSVEGADDHTGYRTVGDTAVGRGSVIGRKRFRGKMIRVTGILVARSCCGVSYGMKWLAAALEGCSGCDAEGCSGSALTMFECCPEYDSDCEVEDDPSPDFPSTDRERHADEFERCLFGSSLVDGPRIIDKQGTGCGRCGSCPYTTVEFTIASEQPYWYAPPKNVLDGETWPIGADQTCHTICEDGNVSVSVYSEGFDGTSGWATLGDPEPVEDGPDGPSAMAFQFEGGDVAAGAQPGGRPTAQSFVIGDLDVGVDHELTLRFVHDQINKPNRTEALRVRLVYTDIPGEPDAVAPILWQVGQPGKQTVEFTPVRERVRVIVEAVGRADNDVLLGVSNVAITRTGGTCDDCLGDHDCTVPGCTGDPMCQAATAPEYPTIRGNCFCESLSEVRQCHSINTGLADWFDVVPIITLFGGDNGLRNVRIEFYENPEQTNCAELIDEDDRCQPCLVFNVAYVAPSTVFVIDGRTRTVEVNCPGVVTSANGSEVLFGRDGRPVDWGVLTCGFSYCVCISADALANGGPAENATVTIDLSTREG